jgi:hypothetical protein
LQFGRVYVGDFESGRVQLRNDGDAWVAVAPRLTGCTGFRLPDDHAFVLQPGESRFVTVRFWPYEDGPVACSVDLNGGGECDQVVLLAYGVGPECTANIEHVDFGSVAVGSWSDWSFELRNSGGGTLEGSVFESCPDITILSGAGPYSFRHGEGRMIGVRFAPQTPGEKSCLIETGSDLCLDVLVSGTGLGPECVVEPDTLDFGTVQVGTIAEAGFTITNRGPAPLTGSIPMRCGDFSLSEGWGAFTLGQNETWAVRVRFRPIAAGRSVCALPLGTECGALTLLGDAWGSLCRVEPEVLDFGAVPAWSASELEVTVTNIGAVGRLDLGVRNLTCPGFTIVRGGGAAYLDPGERHVVAVRFAPPTSGPHECTLDLGTPACPAVPCRGEGIGVVCEITPSAIDFGTVRVGTSVDTTVTIRNAGGGALIAVPELDCPDFSFPWGAGTIALEHDQTRTLHFRWRPTSPGPATCALTIGSICDSVPLSGTCFDPPPVCSVSEDTLRFGIATAGRTGGERSFDIRNLGGQSLSGTITESSPDFEITFGGGSFHLQAGARRTVTVRFTPTAVGVRRGLIDLGSPDCPPVACEGAGVSYRVLAQMREVDDIARLTVNERVTYTAKFGKRGTDQDGWYDIGHYPGDSGAIDITRLLDLGENRLRFTLENTACCGASVTVSLWKGNETLFHREFVGDGHHDGILYDRTVTFEAGVE